MRARVRQKALRLIVSQLVASDFSPSELRDIAHDLRFGSLGDDVTYVLETLYQQLGRDELTKGADYEADQLFEVVQKKRISKKMLFDSMRAVLGFGHSAISLDLTVREMVNNFFKFANEDQIKVLSLMLDGNERDDPYLTGIMNRK